MITDAELELKAAFLREVVPKLQARKWRTEMFDMKPIPLGKGAVLLPALPMALLSACRVNKAGQLFIKIHDRKTYLQLSGLKQLRVSWG